MSETKDFCLAFECPLTEVPDELLHVCSALGDTCENCHHKFSGNLVSVF